METYARMLDKKKKPTEKNIEQFLGGESTARLHAFEGMLLSHYKNFQEELRFPFGNNYGWGYKCTDGRKHLCYIFFEEGAFTVTLQIGDQSVPAVIAMLPDLLEQTQALWENRYPCGETGGWIHYRVLSDAVLPDIVRLILAKQRPTKAADPGA